MEPLLVALMKLRSDLVSVCSDFELIEAHLRGRGASYHLRISDLEAHVEDMSRHFKEVLACLESRGHRAA